MSISYPLTLPTNMGMARVRISQRSASQISESPFTYQQQVQKHSGQMWLADITLPPMSREDAEPWISFLLQLNGVEGTFLLGDQSARAPQGVATGTPLVKGANQTGQILLTDGWANSVTNILKAGDWFQVGQRLHKVVKNTNSDGSGNASLDIYPRLRESPGDNEALILTNPVGLFRLSANSMPIYDVGADFIYGLSFQAREAI